MSLATPQSDPEAFDFEKLSRNWSAEAKSQALTAIRAANDGDAQVWYCTNPARKCDGKPHAGYDYPHARGDQWPPAGSDWLVWALFGGRGSGKTRTGAEYCRVLSRHAGRIAIIAPTGPDARENLVEGESGLMSVFARAGERLEYQPSRRRVVFPSGSIGTLFSGEEPARLRGPQHHAAWLDEPAHIPLIDDVWDMLMFGLRLGKRPHVILTTTPLPTKWVKDRAKDPLTRAVAASTYSNLHNLAPTFRDQVLKRYEGTRLGNQELLGQILADVEGALWNMDLIQYLDLPREEMDRVVVAVDPAGSTTKRSDETGIVVVGKQGDIGHVMQDLTGKYSPNEWATVADRAFRQWDADAIVVERNFGADMVTSTLRSIRSEARIIEVRASKGKDIRAEPTVSQYEQGRVFHRTGLGKLEDEMVGWVPGKGASPNRVDALVWGMSELFKHQSVMDFARPRGHRSAQRTSASGPSRRRFETPRRR